MAQQVMKHVTLIVGPERSDVKPAGEAPLPQGSAGLPPSGVVADSRARSQLTGATTLCIETQLADEKVHLLVEMLLGLEADGTRDACETLIDILIRTRLLGADAARGRVFEQILSSVEKLVIQHAFVESGKVQARAADWLGIDRNTLHKKLRKYNLMQPVADPRTDAGQPAEC